MEDPPSVNTPEGKRAFVLSFLQNVGKYIAEAVEEMPDEWDGRHIRLIVAEKFKAEANMNPCKEVSRKTKRSEAYDNVRRIASF